MRNFLHHWLPGLFALPKPKKVARPRTLISIDQNRHRLYFIQDDKIVSRKELKG